MRRAARVSNAPGCESFECAGLQEFRMRRAARVSNAPGCESSKPFECAGLQEFRMRRAQGFRTAQCLRKPEPFEPRLREPEPFERRLREPESFEPRLREPEPFERRLREPESFEPRPLKRRFCFRHFPVTIRAFWFCDCIHVLRSRFSSRLQASGPRPASRRWAPATPSRNRRSACSSWRGRSRAFESTPTTN